MKPFDEILFEKRNKEYGSYVLRKKYGKHLMTSLIIGILFLGTVIAYPVIASYMNKSKTSKDLKREPKPAEIFTVVEEQPVLEGMYEFLSKNIRYPDEAKELGIQGKVFVTFVVEADGSVSNVRVLRGIGGGCDEEAIRVVQSMPKWTPGKQRGNSVRVQFNIPVKFTLN